MTDKILIRLEYISDPPEKVLLMYDAVGGFMWQNRPLEGLKVGEITAAAGIGKGTAYEYFSSKEEMITHAVVYQCSRKIREAEAAVFSVPDFAGRMDRAKKWISENRGYHMLIQQLARKYDFGDQGQEIRAVEQQEEKPLAFYVSEYMNGMLNRLMEDAWKEGVITETDSDKRILALKTMITGYFFFTVGSMKEEKGKKSTGEGKSLDDEETWNFLCRGLIRSLT